MEFSPFLIFLIISIISSIFNVIKKSQEKGTRRDSLPEIKPLPKKIDQDLFDWDDFSMFEQEEELTEPQISSRDQELTRLTTNLNKVVDALGNDEEPDSELKSVKKGSDRLVQVVERIKEIDVYDQDLASRSQMIPQMTRENIIQGVIMAEILRPPRARRPYRPSYLEDK